jgi:signal peptidase I
VLQIFRVCEDSMTPEYVEGDFVLVGRIPFVFGLQVGDVIVFRRQPYGTLIKRVQAISADGGQIYVAGQHSTSVDSRTFGPVMSADVVGKVLWHIPAARRP